MVKRINWILLLATGFAAAQAQEVSLRRGGASANAVKTQIGTAISVYVLVAII